MAVLTLCFQNTFACKESVQKLTIWYSWWLNNLQTANFSFDNQTHAHTSTHSTKYFHSYYETHTKPNYFMVVHVSSTRHVWWLKCRENNRNRFVAVYYCVPDSREVKSNKKVEIVRRTCKTSCKSWNTPQFLDKCSKMVFWRLWFEYK